MLGPSCEDCFEFGSDALRLFSGDGFCVGESKSRLHGPLGDPLVFEFDLVEETKKAFDYCDGTYFSFNLFVTRFD